MNLALKRASIIRSLFSSLVSMDIMTWSMWALATVPWGFPKAPCIPVWSLDWERQTGMSVGKAYLQGPLGQPIQATGCTHYQGGCCLWSLYARPQRKEHSWLNWRQFETLLHRHTKIQVKVRQNPWKSFKCTMKNFRTIGNNNLINYSLSPTPRFKCGTLTSAINEAFKNKIQFTLNSFRIVLKMCFPLQIQYYLLSHPSINHFLAAINIQSLNFGESLN